MFVGPSPCMKAAPLPAKCVEVALLKELKEFFDCLRAINIRPYGAKSSDKYPDSETSEHHSHRRSKRIIKLVTGSKPEASSYRLSDYLSLSDAPRTLRPSARSITHPPTEGINCL
jgi:hypothetical protein